MINSASELVPSRNALGAGEHWAPAFETLARKRHGARHDWVDMSGHAKVPAGPLISDAASADLSPECAVHRFSDPQLVADDGSGR